MSTTLIVAGAMALIQIILLIIVIVMLIKQFKHGGALHGIIGLITCGTWTFIWGWIKHKSLQLTKIMILWTILILSPVALLGVFGVSMLPELVKMINSLSEEKGFEKMIESFEDKFGEKLTGKKTKKTKRVAKTSKPSRTKETSGKDGDWSQQAVALWEDGKYSDPQKALDFWNKAIRKGPKTAEAYNNRGLAFYNLKRYQPAIKDFSQAIRMNPEDATAYNNRGNTYYEMFKYEQAKTDFNKSIELNPAYAKAYLNRGLVYYQLDQNKPACADFAKACDLEPENCDGIKWAKEKGVCK